MKNALTIILSTLLVLTLAAGDAFAQKKKTKTKEKRFEPATRSTLKDYEGRYVGIEASYFIEITSA
ncbi:MAG: hypothetical protein JOZ52_15065, partial [Acidobacteria bacterium]|nr:hypothetical protein [Acidobacteriota bacterium]